MELQKKNKNEDFDVVSFVGDIDGIRHRYGYLYISLPVGTMTTFSFGAGGQSIELKLKKNGYYWEDLLHSCYTLPETRRAIKKDPYKLALIENLAQIQLWKHWYLT